jgi:lactate dehydrogenase-like 2-hydroxyacid dehydrogenase
VPLNSTTRHLINRETLALCRGAPLLINTARGALVDSVAVIEALDEPKLAGFGLDVLEDERVFRGGATKILGEKIAERVRSAAAPVSRETSPSEWRSFQSS